MQKRPEHVLKTLHNAGFSAYFVGGCVRDTLLGRPVHDWDIATAARPEQVTEIFPHCVPTGLKHGTITVLDGDESFEVTTFRVDGAYLDGRHPEQVRFVSELREDLSRRDFTVNAMAMDCGGEVLDLFGGKEDLAARRIRCVGDPAARFREDALRMLRAVRFCAQLGFTMEQETYRAVKTCAPLCADLSAERVRDEVEKTLLSDDPDAAHEMVRLRLLSDFGLFGGTDKPSLKALPREREARWAGFFLTYPQASWEQFKLDRKCGETAQKSARLAAPERDEIAWKRLISRHGESVARCTAALSGEKDKVERILQSGDCLFLRDLAVSGKDLRQEGKALGQTLDRLLEHVLLHPEDNVREILLALAEQKTTPKGEQQ